MGYVVFVSQSSNSGTLLPEEKLEVELMEDQRVNFTTECVVGLGYAFTWFLKVLKGGKKNEATRNFEMLLIQNVEA